jgi:hypothetical protein
MRVLFILLVIFFIPACELISPVDHTPTPIDELISAPDRLVIDNREYILDTYMWRDFQPISRPDGKPLIAIIWVIAVDSLAVPSDLDATRLWVIYDGEVWETPFSDEERPQTPGYKLEKVARNGPKWGPDITVDVVVRIVDRRTGEDYLLKATDQYVGMTV